MQIENTEAVHVIHFTCTDVVNVKLRTASSRLMQVNPEIQFTFKLGGLRQQQNETFTHANHDIIYC